MLGDLLLYGAVLGALGGLLWWLQTSSPPRRPAPRIRAADPLLEVARERARGSVDELGALLREHPVRAMVKLRVDRPDGAYRGRWADVHRLEGGRVHGALRGSGRPVDLALGEIEDWQVALPDGSFRGAYTVAAVIRIRARAAGRLRPRDQAALRRLLDGQP